MANTYIFKKVSGGGTVQVNSADIRSLLNPNIVSGGGSLIIYTFGASAFISINPVIDTVTIDLTPVGGSLATYAPNTITIETLQVSLMNVFNPSSNVLVA